MFLIEINGHFGTKNIQNDRYGAKMTVIETIWLIFTTYDDTGQWSPDRVWSKVNGPKE